MAQRQRAAGLALALVLLVAGCEHRSLSPTGAAGQAGGIGHGGVGGVTGGGAGRGGGTPSKALGQTCASADECVSGFCADGVCCGSACTEGCRTCVAPGSLGVCTSRPSGEGPRAAGDCVVGDPSACGLDGKCDGAGVCRSYLPGTSCKSGSCDGDTVAGGYVCNGAGACKPGPTVICVPYRCDPSTGRCRDGCTTDADCVGVLLCQGGSCRGRSQGICHADADCATGRCADGICCNVACRGPCLACNQLGHMGVCWPIDAGLPDPRVVCVDEGKPSCGQTGTCDGVGGCTRYPAGTTCAAPGCTGSTLTPARTCDGLGGCLAAGSTSCGPYRCDPNGSACLGGCSPDDGSCAPGYTCLSGQCRPPPPGLPCATAAECGTGFCVDGVCCDSACQGPCVTCALPSSLGRCVMVSLGSVDPHGLCAVEPATSCGKDGACDGAGGCRRYVSGTACAAASCSNAILSPARTCDGVGSCSTGPALSCAPYSCNAAGTGCGSSAP